MALDMLIVVSVVGFIFSSLALALVLINPNTMRWRSQGQNGDRTSTRASYPTKHLS
ncbi:MULTISPECIES: hypothetical protein [unclassified Bradyrhizobium]|jgi:hypothetical protein|uniref:hypothetical protein n=1 Tax=unclassified Bradyrhizobium TaxID=2631580 RepID=UPI00143D898A|nr:MULTISPECIES: hypothetical protein [unclassified Bradyrhizobium]